MTVRSGRAQVLPGVCRRAGTAGAPKAPVPFSRGVSWQSSLSIHSTPALSPERVRGVSAGPDPVQVQRSEILHGLERIRTRCDGLCEGARRALHFTE